MLAPFYYKSRGPPYSSSTHSLLSHLVFSQPYRRKRTMELNNGASVILVLALSSLLSFSANAFCVTRNDTEFHAPASTFAPMLHHVSVAPSASPPQSSSASPPHSSSASPPQSSSASPPQSSSSSPPTESESESTPPPTESESTPPPTESESTPPTESESESTPTPTESESTPIESTPVPLDSEEASGEKQNDAVVLTNLLTDTSLSVSSATELVKICDVTSNPQLCSKSISTELESTDTSKGKGSGPEVNSVSALKSEIQASIDEVQKALAKVDALRKDSSVSNTEIECLDVCKENFGYALDDLKAGLEAIDAHDVGKMESVLTAVLTNVVTCDDTFAEMGVESPLDDLTNKMNRYASNCLAISKLLM